MEQTPLLIDGTLLVVPRNEFSYEMNSLIDSGYRLEDLEACTRELRSVLNTTDKTEEITLIRLFAVVDYIQRCIGAGSIDSDISETTEELCDDFMEAFEAKIGREEENFFFVPANWITIIQKTPSVQEREHFVEMLEDALRTRIPIEKSPLDHTPDPIGYRLLPSPGGD